MTKKLELKKDKNSSVATSKDQKFVAPKNNQILALAT